LHYELRKWKPAHDIETSEDILTDPSKIPYREEINKVLSPFKNLLKKLLICGPEDLKSETILARDWLESGKKPLQTSLVHIPELFLLLREPRSQIRFCVTSVKISVWKLG
jgi:hypothetical protein